MANDTKQGPFVLGKVKIDTTVKGNQSPLVGPDPQNNLIVFYDDGDGNGGKFYVVPEATWLNPDNLMGSADPMFTTVSQLVQFGGILASVPNGGGAGYACTLVNQESLMQNASDASLVQAAVDVVAAKKKRGQIPNE